MCLLSSKSTWFLPRLYILFKHINRWTQQVELAVRETPPAICYHLRNKLTEWVYVTALTIISILSCHFRSKSKSLQYVMEYIQSKQYLQGILCSFLPTRVQYNLKCVSMCKYFAQVVALVLQVFSVGVRRVSGHVIHCSCHPVGVSIPRKHS